MRPVPPALENWESSIPIFRNTHSIASTWPVDSAINGMASMVLDIACRDGSCVSVVATAVVAHEVTAGTIIRRRQRPSWITSGMLVPAGTLVSVNEPSTPVVVCTRGVPDTSHAQPLEDTPSTNVVTPKGYVVDPLGTYTKAFGRGNVPLGANTVPVSVVVVVPTGQFVTCCRQKFKHWPVFGPVATH